METRTLRIGFTEWKYFKSTRKRLAFKGERVGLKIAKLRMHVVLDEIYDVILFDVYGQKMMLCGLWH